MDELKTCSVFRVKDSVNLFSDLKQFGFSYCGNYFRGDNWQRTMDGIDIATGDNPKNGIIIHGDWDNRHISFKFPYRNDLERKSVSPFIQDLISAGLVEQEGRA